MQLNCALKMRREQFEQPAFAARRRSGLLRAQDAQKNQLA